jgi:hypothetical protein
MCFKVPQYDLSNSRNCFPNLIAFYTYKVNAVVFALMTSDNVSDLKCTSLKNSLALHVHLSSKFHSRVYKDQFTFG